MYQKLKKREDNPRKKYEKNSHRKPPKRHKLHQVVPKTEYTLADLLTDDDDYYEDE